MGITEILGANRTPCYLKCRRMDEYGRLNGFCSKSAQVACICEYFQPEPIARPVPVPAVMALAVAPVIVFKGGPCEVALRSTA